MKPTDVTKTDPKVAVAQFESFRQAKKNTETASRLNDEAVKITLASADERQSARVAQLKKLNDEGALSSKYNSTEVARKLAEELGSL